MGRKSKACQACIQNAAIARLALNPHQLTPVDQSSEQPHHPMLISKSSEPDEDSDGSFDGSACSDTESEYSEDSDIEMDDSSPPEDSDEVNCGTEFCGEQEVDISEGGDLEHIPITQSQSKSERSHQLADLGDTCSSNKQDVCNSKPFKTIDSAEAG
ncbi:hypothetical protein DAEQUDRAFT_742058 [Daedalea quercina L-15889]|uniref:Uncharacterized protein n=1 Tax=Daedalea quercina L-15889 TaxID=1314783 RepID=A0A165KJ14_9APHY|nr:hypothetical protein DAEQUDRAFT_742058 [Daedalea quercina L-15889]